MTDTAEEMRREVEELRRQLAEAQETIRAIQSGEVDAVVVHGAEQPGVYTLDAADKPYRLVVEQMRHACAVVSGDGLVLSCNEAFGQLVGRPRESLLQRSLRELIEPASLPLLEALLHDGLAAGGEGELTLHRGDGQRVPVVLGARALNEGVAGVCLLVSDLTEKRRRDRLIADEAMARSILDQVADAVVVCDTHGVVLRASRAAHDLCGADPSLQPFERAFPLTRVGLEGAGGNQPDLRAAWEGAPVRGLEVRLERPGRHAVLLLRAGPLIAARGEVLGVVLTLTDITPLREAQDELRRRAAALQEADRHKDEFLAMLAHELRNPLSPIQASLEVMQLHPAADGQLRRCQEIISRQVQQLTRLVDDLLEVSRISRGKIQLRLEPVELAAAVNTGIETCRPLIERKRHRLTVTMPEDEVWVRADVTRLSQVVGNLVHNAAKYTEDGGEITVRVERGADGFGVIRVRDTGVGIPHAMLGEVFDLFTQVHRSLDRSQGGLGIGLALVRRLISMHGGQVEAHSEGPGRGSEFVVRVPLCEAVQGGAGAAPATATSASRPLRVFVADDNRDAADILGELLTMLGHQVCTAYDGPSTIAAATEFRPDVMLCDIGLPGIDGYGVVAALRERPGFESTRFIAVTGYGREEDRQRSAAIGFHAHLIKPVDINRLKALLRSRGTDDATA